MFELRSNLKTLSLCTVLAASSAMALPPEAPPKQGTSYPPSLPAWINTICPQQCAQATGAAYGSTKWQACVYKCATIGASFQSIAGPSIPPTGVTNCDLTASGDAAWYYTCQAFWAVDTSGLGSALVALGLTQQVANGLIGAAKSAGNPCGYIYSQLNAQFQYLCPGQSLPNP